MEDKQRSMNGGSSAGSTAFRFGDGSFGSPYMVEEALRREDARVNFKVDVFFDGARMETVPWSKSVFGCLAQELFINFFGGLSYPYVVWRHGWYGLENRMFALFTAHSFFAWFQLFLSCSLITTLVLFIYSMPRGAMGPADQITKDGNDPSRSESAPFRIFVFEIIFMVLLYLLRVATIASKYAFMSRAELGQMDAQKIDSEDLESKLVLGGWFAAPEGTVFVEMERSIARNTWGKSDLQVVYPTVVSRDDALRRMAGSIPSFLRLSGSDLGQNCRDFLEGSLDAIQKGYSNRVAYNVDVGQTERMAENASKAFSKTAERVRGGEKESVVGTAPRGGSVPVSRIVMGADMDDLGATAVVEEDDEDEEEDDGADNYGDQTPSVGREVARGPGDMQVIDGFAIQDEQTEDGRTEILSLPAIPLRLVIWHIAKTNISRRKPPMIANLNKLRFIALFIILAPVYIRLAFGENLLEFSAVEWFILMCTIFHNFFNMPTNLAFLALALFDVTRRLDVAIALHRLLDPSVQRLYIHKGTCTYSGVGPARQVSAHDPTGTVAAAAAAAGITAPSPAASNSENTPSNNNNNSAVIVETISHQNRSTPHAIRSASSGVRGSVDHSAAAALVAHAVKATNHSGHKDSHGMSRSDTRASSVHMLDSSIPTTTTTTNNNNIPADGKHSDSDKGMSDTHPDHDDDDDDYNNNNNEKESSTDDAVQKVVVTSKQSPTSQTQQPPPTDSSSSKVAFRSTSQSAAVTRDLPLFPAAGRPMRRVGTQSVMDAVKLGDKLESGVQKATKEAVDNECRRARIIIARGRVTRHRTSAAVTPLDGTVAVDGEDERETVPIDSPDHADTISTQISHGSTSTGSMSSLTGPLGPVTRLPSGGVKSWLVRRSRYLSDRDIAELLSRQFAPMRINLVGYSVNVLSWIAARNVLSDIGRVFAFRIAFFTGLFALCTLIAVVMCFYVLLFPDQFPAVEAFIILVVVGISDIMLGFIITMQLIYGVRVNRGAIFQRRRVGRIEALVQEYIVSPPKQLPTETLNRLKRSRKLLSLATKVIESESLLNPVRVMGIPATSTVLYSFLSLTATALAAAISAAARGGWDDGSLGVNAVASAIPSY